MKIMSFNVQNDMKKITEEKVEEIIKIIKDENPDIIGFQELTYNLKNILNAEFPEYTFYGRSRYALNTFFDEYNCLLVKRNIEVIETTTYSLGKDPSRVRSKNLLSAFPRICTSIVCVLNKKRIKVVNTHLDHLFARSKEYQLAVLYEILNNNEYPLILMGDFNMHSTNEHLKTFTSKMNLTNVTESLGKTQKESEQNKPIDHILIANEFEAKDIHKITKVNYSDHYPICADISIKS